MGVKTSMKGPSDAGSADDMKNGRAPSWKSFLLRPRFRTVAKYCPLVAAILAPLATLLDIPALTEHWYTRDGIPEPDPKACLILSAISLIFNAFANIFLVVRFSARAPFWWQHATRWSLIMWLAKTAVAAANLIAFGVLRRNGEGYRYDEGFWCAVVSIIAAGVICITLLLHYFVSFGDGSEDSQEVRKEGKRFMLSFTTFIAVMAVQSLVFCKVEHWSYSDAIYFSVQTALTIGYGDYVPTTTAGKVLVFPFSVLTISLLGNMIARIIGFIGSRSEARRERWRKQYEEVMHDEANKLRPKASLIEEMALIHEINSREETLSQLYELMWSVASLIIFWVIGATMFSQIEGWTYGNAIYAVMILSLTIGFGDFSPVEPAGRVAFIVYALMAVPIVTSFAVQTVTGLLSTFSERGAIQENFRTAKQRAPDAFAPHADFVQRAHKSLRDAREKMLAANGEPVPPVGSFKIDEKSDLDGGRGQEDHSNWNQVNRERHEGKDREVDEGVLSEGSGSDRSERPPGPNQVVRTASPQTYEEPESRSSKWDNSDSRGTNGGGRSDENKEERQLDDQDRTIQEDYKRVDAAEKDERERGSGGKEGEDEKETKKDLELDLLRQLLERTIQLEAEARQMLLDSMDKGIARMLLLADRNVQVRDVRRMRGDDANMLAIWRGEEEQTAHDKKRRRDNDETNLYQKDMLSRVQRYRNTFAEILVIGSILQKFEGEDLNRFERWRKFEVEEAGEERRRAQSDLDKVADKQFHGLSKRILGRKTKLFRSKTVPEVEGEDMA